MKRKILIALIFITALTGLLFCGCVAANLFSFNSVTGTGNLETYEYSVGEYNRVLVEGFCEIHYYSAPSNTVTLAVQPNLHEYFVVEVVDRELIIKTTRSINPGKTPVLTISVPELNSLFVSGACNFITHDKITSDSLTINFSGAGDNKAELDVQTLSVEISGAGKLNLSGSANTARFDLSGAGELNALSLETQNTTINLSGAGTIKISCSERLTINASGAGTIQYRGSPSISRNTSGIVSIRQVN
ncbi:MAG: DUF2807 domain-containing protein [Treponema sp.]|nr:DUF2807 domain-containing protein [Treponema sp.]